MTTLSTQHSALNPQHWLITGGCGFIGTSLIRHLVAESNCHIRVLDNLFVGTRDDLACVCKFTELSSDSLSAQSSALSTQHSVLSLLSETLKITLPV